MMNCTRQLEELCGLGSKQAEKSDLDSIYEEYEGQAEESELDRFYEENVLSKINMTEKDESA